MSVTVCTSNSYGPISCLPCIEQYWEADLRHVTCKAERVGWMIAGCLVLAQAPGPFSFIAREWKVLFLVKKAF